jgi:hypothetical protein
VPSVWVADDVAELVSGAERGDRPMREVGEVRVVERHTQHEEPTVLVELGPDETTPIETRPGENRPSRVPQPVRWIQLAANGRRPADHRGCRCTDRFGQRHCHRWWVGVR